MSAVLDLPETVVANWEMPPVKVSAAVVWMPDYQRTDDARLAFIEQVSLRSVRLIVPINGGLDRKYDVRHVDDPILARNPNLRQNGAWDYSPDAKRMDMIEKRVSALESGVALGSCRSGKEDIRGTQEEIERKISQSERMKAVWAARKARAAEEAQEAVE